jgi:hypothetical protein
MHHLENLYEAQNLDSGEVQAQYASDDPLKDISSLRLRAIIFDLLEQLPPLLELGEVPQDAMSTLVKEFDFPYHRPSIISLVSDNGAPMPESIGFVLLQVSDCFNAFLLDILVCFLGMSLVE